MRLPCWPLVLPGCAAPAADGTDSGAPALPEIALATPAPAWGPAEAEAALAVALSTGFPTPARPMLAYLDLMKEGDGVCPGDGLQILDYNLLGCTSVNGTWYAGVSTWMEEDLQLGSGMLQAHIQSWVVTGDFEITDPGGDRFEGGGHVAVTGFQKVHLTGFEGQMVGTWRWEGDDAWLADGISASLIIQGRRNGPQEELVLDGAITLRGLALDLGELRYNSACPTQPEGSLGIRDPAGAWHQVALTGCLPCGPSVYADRVDEGELCPDLSEVPAQIEETLGALSQEGPL